MRARHIWSLSHPNLLILRSDTSPGVTRIPTRPGRFDPKLGRNDPIALRSSGLLASQLAENKGFIPSAWFLLRGWHVDCCLVARRKADSHETASRRRSYMTTKDLDYASDQFDRDDRQEREMSPLPKWHHRKRPTYCKKRTPVRLGMKRRRNHRSSSPSH